jgi:hypothetical protein
MFGNWLGEFLITLSEVFSLEPHFLLVNVAMHE